jgi:hypothetical protein
MARIRLMLVFVVVARWSSTYLQFLLLQSFRKIDQFCLHTDIYLDVRIYLDVFVDYFRCVC